MYEITKGLVHSSSDVLRSHPHPKNQLHRGNWLTPHDFYDHNVLQLSRIRCPMIRASAAARVPPLH